MTIRITFETKEPPEIVQAFLKYFIRHPGNRFYIYNNPAMDADNGVGFGLLVEVKDLEDFEEDEEVTTRITFETKEPPEIVHAFLKYFIRHPGNRFCIYNDPGFNSIDLLVEVNAFEEDEDE